MDTIHDHDVEARASNWFVEAMKQLTVQEFGISTRFRFGGESSPGDFRFNVPANEHEPPSYYDESNETSRRHQRAVKDVVIMGRDGVAAATHKDVNPTLRLRDGREINVSGSPWEIAEARLAEWLMHCDVEDCVCGCLGTVCSRHLAYCEHDAVVMMVFGDNHVPICQTCAREILSRRGILALDWLPDEV